MQDTLTLWPALLLLMMAVGDSKCSVSLMLAPSPRFSPQEMKETWVFSWYIKQIDLDINRSFRNHIMVMFWDCFGVG